MSNRNDQLYHNQQNNMSGCICISIYSTQYYSRKIRLNNTSDSLHIHWTADQNNMLDIAVFPSLIIAQLHATQSFILCTLLHMYLLNSIKHHSVVLITYNCRILNHCQQQLAPKCFVTVIFHDHLCLQLVLKIALTFNA